MTKLEFVLELNDRLSGLPSDEIEECIGFYVEMIEDGVEDGISEEEAVARIGKIDEIVDQIIAGIPFTKIAKEKIKPKRSPRRRSNPTSRRPMIRIPPGLPLRRSPRSDRSSAVPAIPRSRMPGRSVWRPM